MRTIRLIKNNFVNQILKFRKSINSSSTANICTDLLFYYFYVTHQICFVHQMFLFFIRLIIKLGLMLQRYIAYFIFIGVTLSNITQRIILIGAELCLPQYSKKLDLERFRQHYSGQSVKANKCGRYNLRTSS